MYVWNKHRIISMHTCILVHVYTPCRYIERASFRRFAEADLLRGQFQGQEKKRKSQEKKKKKVFTCTINFCLASGRVPAVTL